MKIAILEYTPFSHAHQYRIVLAGGFSRKLDGLWSPSDSYILAVETSKQLLSFYTNVKPPSPTRGFSCWEYAGCATDWDGVVQDPRVWWMVYRYIMIYHSLAFSRGLKTSQWNFMVDPHFPLWKYLWKPGILRSPFQKAAPQRVPGTGRGETSDRRGGLGNTSIKPGETSEKSMENQSKFWETPQFWANVLAA